MAQDHESKLFLVEKTSNSPKTARRKTYEVFRTRAAARDRMGALNARGNYSCKVLPAKWGADA